MSRFKFFEENIIKFDIQIGFMGIDNVYTNLYNLHHTQYDIVWERHDNIEDNSGISEYNGPIDYFDTHYRRRRDNLIIFGSSHYLSPVPRIVDICTNQCIYIRGNPTFTPDEEVTIRYKLYHR
jgi:hypothetical protein